MNRIYCIQQQYNDGTTNNGRVRYEDFWDAHRQAENLTRLTGNFYRAVEVTA